MLRRAPCKGMIRQSAHAGMSRPCAIHCSVPLCSAGKRQCSRSSSSSNTLVRAIAAPVAPPQRSLQAPYVPDQVHAASPDLSAPPPFTMADLRKAIPEHCFKKDVWRSVRFLARDVVLVAGLAFGAHQLDTWWVWPAYWLAQGTMFWALFVVGHDCGHQSFSNSKKVNNLVGNITHSSILVPYHGWRISHRMHHTHHGHVENDESWYPIPEKIYKSMDSIARIGRLTLPWALLAYPFYLWKRTPGKTGSHYDPECDLFTPNEAQLVHTSNRFLQGMLAVLAGCTLWLGPMAMLKLYVMPYWFNVMWLMLVTYLHHHGPSDKEEKMPWYRGQDWSYLRGGLTTLDRDYGMFNKIHHDIGTHVLHHLFPQMPHYHLEEATAAVKPVMGDYYREREKSKGPIPFHLLRPLIRSFSEDHYVADTGSIVYYQKDAGFSS